MSYIYIYIYGAPIIDVSRSHTTTQHSRYDSSGWVISSSQRPLPDKTQHSQQTNIHAPGGIRTHDLSRRAATDLRLRRRTFIILPRRIFRMRNVSDKVVERIKTHILCSITFSRKSCSLWENVEKYSGAWQATNDNMATLFACWTTKATDTHSEYVILIVFPLQQCLHERASVLRYASTTCLVLKCFVKATINLIYMARVVFEPVTKAWEYISHIDRSHCDLHYSRT